MIGQKLRPVSRKMWQFHLNMNIEGRFWRHAVTSSVTSSTSKVLILGWFRTVFPYLMSKWNYLKYFEIFKMAAILRSGRTFKPEVVPEVAFYSKIGHATPYILRFCSTLKLKYWQSYGYLKIWPSFQPDDVIDDVINTKKYTPIARCKFHICAKFGVDCLNGATSIVNITDPQTDKPSDEHTCQIFGK